MQITKNVIPKQIVYMLALLWGTAFGCGDDLKPEKERVLEWPPFESSAAEVTASYERAVDNAQQALSVILSQSPDNVSFTSTVAALDALEHDFSKHWYRISLLSSTSPIPQVREAASNIMVAMENWHVQNIALNRQLYHRIQAVAESPDADKLGGEDRRLLDEMLATYRLQGVELSEPDRVQLQQWQARLAELTTAILDNIAAAEGTVSLSHTELQGLSEEQLQLFEYDEPTQTYLVRTGLANQYKAVMQNAERADVRRRALEARMSRAKEVNGPLIVEVIEIRTRVAALLGVATWADFRTQMRMAQSGEQAANFLLDINDLIADKFHSEQTVLTELKREDLQDSSADLVIEDIPYYSNMLLAQNYDIDEEVVRQYFVEDQVLRRIFDMYEELFSIRIALKQPRDAWAEDVQAAVVSDNRTGEVLGAIYLDLHARPGKYTHFAMFPVIQGRALADKRYQAPVAAIVGNWPAAGSNMPSLWTLDNVRTMLHLFGHALHEVVTTARYHRLAGTNVPLDFVEAPPELLERWLQSPEVLARLGAHRETGASMPRTLINNLVAAQSATIAHDYAWLVTRSSMDLKLHMYTDVTQVPTTPENAYAQTNELFTTYYYPVPADTAHLASFLHPFAGYDAGYYSYLWSEVIAADIASRFRASDRGFLDAGLGMRLREDILEKGNSRPVNESIHGFLQKDWSAEAFVEEMYGTQTLGKDADGQ